LKAFARISRVRPQLYVVDDLHWAARHHGIYPLVYPTARFLPKHVVLFRDHLVKELPPPLKM